MTDADAAVNRAANELYGVILEEFTERRNEQARALRKAGDRAAADAVKALRKPSQTAWALNQVARRRRQDVERLLEAGEQLRRAQQAVLSGEDPGALTAATESERRVVGELVEASAAIAAECGVGATDTLRERLRSTLEAAVRDTEVGEALRAGRLVGDHQAVGLFDLSAWSSPPEGSPRPPQPSKKAGSRATRPRKEKQETSEKPTKADGQKAARAAREAERAKRIEEARQQFEEAQQRRESVAASLEESTRTADRARDRALQAVAEAASAEAAQREQQAELEEAEAKERRLEKQLARAERSKAE